MRIIACLGVLLMLFVKGEPAAARQQSGATTQPAARTADVDRQTRVKRWSEDLEALVNGVAKHHKNAFFKISKSDFKNAAETIRSRLGEWDDQRIIVEFMRLAAMLGDGHTSVDYNAANPPFRFYPINVMAFNDGLFVVAADVEHEVIVGHRLVRIGDVDAEEAARRVSTVFPFENESWRRHALRRFMNIVEVLHAVDIIADIQHASFTVVDREGVEHSVELTPLSAGEKPQFVTALDAVKESVPFSMQQRREWYWFKWLPESNAIYSRYDKCADDSQLSVEGFSKNLLEVIDAHAGAKLIFDLRNNGGGNSALLNPLFDALKQRQKSGRLGPLTVLIGRATFSSGQLNANTFRRDLGAKVIGEPTGQKPNAYGEVRGFDLPNSHLHVNYSTKFFKTDPDDPPSMMPDVLVEVTAADYFAGLDQAMEAALRGEMH